MIVKASREHGSFLGTLARLLGLSALAEGPLWRNRSAKVRTGGIAISLAAAVGIVGLLIPPARAPIGTVLRAPGNLVQALGGGGLPDASSVYPRVVERRLGIDLPIVPGDGGLRPPVAKVAYQFPKTAELGHPGNSYLYSHDRSGMFQGLHKASVGDVFVVELSSSDRVYFQVTEIHGNVAWNDLEWLQPSSDTRLTLQTCNYSGDYDPRYIVVAKSIPSSTGRALAGL